MIRQARAHWLRGNAGEKTPRRLIVLDTESRVIETEPREVQALRCWVAWVIIRPDELGAPFTHTEHWGTEAAEIADLAEATLKGGKPWRLFTHNLSYDLGLTRLPLELLRRGWTIGKHNLASDQPWAYLKKGRSGLWLCDSWGWLPQPLEKLGESLGIPKPALPREDDALEDWVKRCRADVRITAVALCQLLEEWDRRQLGWWSITGPASGWNTMLHFPARGRTNKGEPNVTHSENPYRQKTGQRVLIVPDAAARAFERKALYSGRRDVWRIGDLGKGPWAEVDLKTAHLAICAYQALPYRRWAAFDRLDLDDWRLASDAAGVVATCRLRVAAPRYPLRLKGAVLHPVGDFETVLAGPEIADARARGELISIGPGYGYHLGQQMQGWAQWALAVLNDTSGEVAPMLRVAVKGWSRSVPGRWGMTHARPIKEGPSHVKDWALEPITIGIPPRRGSIFHLAGRWVESINDQEADDSFPAVLAYVQSYCRLALNRMLDAIPEAELVSCNTEGAWVSQRGLDPNWPSQHPRPGFGQANDCATGAALAYLSAITAPLNVQLKETAQTLRVLSPQHHQADQLRLYSGIPRSAVDLGGQKFSFQTWPKLKGQIERGDPRGYVREHRTVSLAGVPVSRWAFQGGHCEPVEARWSPETGNVLCPPSEAAFTRHGPLRAVQHPVLRKVLAQT